jgi:hypothetical protein
MPLYLGRTKETVKLEERVESLAQRQPTPTSKNKMASNLIHVVLDVVDRSGDPLSWQRLRLKSK